MNQGVSKINIKKLQELLIKKQNEFNIGGFKFEAQHARVIDETPLRVF